MELPEKTFQYLLHLFDTSTTYDVHEFLAHSKITAEKDYISGFSDAMALFILIDPEIFKKYQGSIKQFENSISSKLSHFTNTYVSKVKTYPDLERFQILENRIVPINTPWQEINSGQTHLLNLQRTATETIDFQNIGNSSRTLLQKVANIVFNPIKHICTDKNVDLGEAKFKNRLHTYIKSELTGSENKELRDYSFSVITTAEKSVDLANKLTHDLKANRLMSELCVISTITVISIIKLIAK
jgi:hypothetical protein